MTKKQKKSSRRRHLSRNRRYVKSGTRAERQAFLRRVQGSGSVVEKPQVQSSIEAKSEKVGFLGRMSSALKSVTRRQASRGG